MQRFASAADLDRYEVTLEEGEEYEPHLARGTPVFASVDYAHVIESAQGEAETMVWNGGNNDFPFVWPDLHIVLADPRRPGHEVSYHPGEANLQMADIVVITKIDTAAAEIVDPRPYAVGTVRETSNSILI